MIIIVAKQSITAKVNKRSLVRGNLVDHEDKIIDIRHGQFQVELLQGGTGPTLVYLHGASGHAGWSPFLDHLAQSFRIIAPVQPGVGNSTGLEHLDTLWDLIIFYEDFINELDIKTFHLCGSGYGGMIAAELAAHCPRLISRLALTAPFGLWIDDNPTIDIFALTPSERKHLEWFNPDNETASNLSFQSDDQISILEQALLNTQTAQAIGKFMWPIAEHGLSKRAHRVTMPTLLIWGDSDQIIPLSYAYAFQNLLSNSELTIIEQCGHLPHLENPGDYCSALIKFLST